MADSEFTGDYESETDMNSDGQLDSVLEASNQMDAELEEVRRSEKASDEMDVEVLGNRRSERTRLQPDGTPQTSISFQLDDLEGTAADKAEQQRISRQQGFQIQTMKDTYYLDETDFDTVEDDDTTTIQNGEGNLLFY